MRRLASLAALGAATVALAQPAPLSDEVALSPAAVTTAHFAAQVVRRADGSLAAAWTVNTPPNFDVVAGTFDAAGVSLSGVVAVNQTTAGTQIAPSVAADDDGNFIVAWRSDNGDSAVMARRFDADGAPLGDEFRVNAETPGTVPEGEMDSPSVAMAGDGRFVVVWERDENVHARRYDADGVALGAPLDVANPNSGFPQPDVVMRDDGSFVVAYSHVASAIGQDVYLKGFDASGGVAFGPVQANADISGMDLANPHSEPSIAAAVDGSFQVAWRRLNGTAVDVYLRRFAAGGAALADQQRAGAAAGQGPVTLGVGPLGVATVAWLDADATTLCARSYAGSGAADGNPYVVSSGPDGFGGFTTRGVAFDGDGTFLVAWHRSVGSAVPRIYARRYSVVGASSSSGASGSCRAGGEGGGGALGPAALLWLGTMLLWRRRPTGAGRTSGSPARC